MNRHDVRTGHGLRLMILYGFIAVVIGFLAAPVAALAHPLDVYLQASYITVAPKQIVVELDLTPGVLVAPQVLAELDSNGDQQISDAESQVYVDTLVRKLVLQVDGQPLALAVSRIDLPAYLTLQAGYGTIRIFTAATLAEGMAGTHQIAYTNTFAPSGSAYQVNAFVETGMAITLGKQSRDRIQQSMTMDYTIGGTVIVPTAAPAAVTTTNAPTTEAAGMDILAATPASASDQARQLLAYLYQPASSPWVLLLGLALAGVLGGLHALTPGHGKTLVAAYLVGSRGTVRHAIALGAIVTFTHTASVIVIGVLALFASQYIVPNVLVPILEILSGLLVVFMGVRLVWQRWSAFHRRESSGYDHGHRHDREDGHAHGLTHDHGDGQTHTHLPQASGIKLGSLLAMGVSGGLVPCPEALGIMVIAIGLNRIMLGLGLIVSFSFGLAAVLIIIGILLVRSRSLVERVGGIGTRWSTAIPLASAVIVTVLGIAMTLSGLATYLG